METEDIGEWLPVQGKRRGRETSPPKKTRQQTQLTVLSRKPAATSKELLSADKEDYRKLVKPGAKQVPRMQTVAENEEEEEVIESETETFAESTMASHEETVSEQTTDIQKPAPFPMVVSVNDGTHRVKIKWTLSEDKTHLNENPDQLNKSIKE